MKLSGWGRFPQVDCRILEPASDDELRAALKESRSIIARGNGRGYGDAALNPEGTVLTRRLNRFLAFDQESGLLVCEAGTLLSDILATFVPRGWFVPVTPGTKYVSVGGMVAADVHGKNHPQAGSFARHVAWMDVMIADGSIVRCSPAENAELFEATLGGMGLTGVVIRVVFTLQRIETDMIVQQTVRTASFREAIEVLESNPKATYSAAWIDCLALGKHLGRSIVMLGEHVRSTDLSAPYAGPRSSSFRSPSIRIPVGLPSFILNRSTVSAFNELYFRCTSLGRKLVPMGRFFYPLDSVDGWNRIYGKRGLAQYQFVLPRSAALTGMTDILGRIAKQGANPFLAVLKRFGTGRGMMSFPTEGYTLALDFPATVQNLDLLATLDHAVCDYGGRVYLAKDARSKNEFVVRGYPAIEEFRAARRKVDPLGRFSSLLSRRLGL